MLMRHANARRECGQTGEKTETPCPDTVSFSKTIQNRLQNELGRIGPAPAAVKA
jgi:hypothetical protein